MSWGRFERDDLRRAPRFKAAKEVTVSRVAERIGEVVAFAVVLFFTLELGPLFLGDIGSVFDVFDEAPYRLSATVSDDLRLDEFFLSAFAVRFLD